MAISVSDEEILDAVKLLAKEGVLTEPTGAVSIAGLRNKWLVVFKKSPDWNEPAAYRFL